MANEMSDADQKRTTDVVEELPDAGHIHSGPRWWPHKEPWQPKEGDCRVVRCVCGGDGVESAMTKIPDWALNRGTGNEIEPGVIVRHNPDGTIDEICFDAAGVNFHLEQMDTGTYWIGVSWTDADGTERMQHITLATPRNTPLYPTTYT